MRPFKKFFLDRTTRLLLVVSVLAAVFTATSNSWAYQRFPEGEFPKTDLSKAAVPIDEFLTGGPPRDGIPAIDSPVFVDSATASTWLEGNEPVVVFEHAGDARAYPLQILMFHEIVNDTVADLPVTITFCPLCNASIVFERTIEDTVLDFGTTGWLRNSDLVMYDRQTETWWQQFTGRGLIGDYTDVKLQQRPSVIASFATFREAYAEGKVLSRETGYRRNYGQNPYRGYDDITSSPFLYRGEIDSRLPPMERVLSVPKAEHIELVPLTELAENPVVMLPRAATDIVVLAATKAASALDDQTIAKSRAIPAAAAFVAEVDGMPLSFTLVDGQVQDTNTGSTWDAFGRAVAGELLGSKLEQVDRGVHFAFAWLAFDADATIYRAQKAR